MKAASFHIKICGFHMKIGSFHMKISGFHERPFARNCNPYLFDLSLKLLNEKHFEMF